MAPAPEVSFELRLTLPGPVDVVWDYLRRPELLARWHGWGGTDLEAEIQAVYFDNTITDGTSMRVGGHLFELEADPTDQARTLVRITHCDPVDGSDWAPFYSDIDEGWITFLEQLRFLLEHRPSGDRHSWMREVTIDHTSMNRLREGLPTGPLTGQVWFTTEQQVGIVATTPDCWLTVLAQPEVSEPRLGRLSLLWYGDQTRFETMRAELDAWSAVLGADSRGLEPGE